tara:strand:+ start:1983 stop:3536 length:1554 start_codon:yes stop_codon:yes gene_type:complete
MGNRNFATVSALSGFDFLDDARALALMDWDVDGRMDFWVSNRTAPRLRFMRNELEKTGDWLQIGLEGGDLLDPFGARVEVTLVNGPKLLSSLRAGEGFLGQSTRWLHFGLGKNSVKKVRVRWIDGTWEEFTGLGKNARFLCREGKGKALPVSASEKRLMSGQPFTKTSENTSVFIPLPVALPLPVLHYQNPDGAAAQITPGQGKPILINLWDPTCADCETELRDWKKERAQFPADLQVLALIASGGGREEGAQFISSHELPFTWGVLTPDSAKLLAEIVQKNMSTLEAVPAPTSFLVNAQGDLVALSIGILPGKEVVDQLAKGILTNVPNAQRMQTVFGRGQWVAGDERWLDLIHIPIASMKLGRHKEAATYVRRAYSHLSHHKEIDRLLVWIGESYLKEGNATEGLKFFLNALSNGTRDPLVMNNVAWELATHADPKVRNGKLALKWALAAIQEVGDKDATYLDTLAASYAENGQFEEALQVVQRGLYISQQEGQKHLNLGLLKAQKLYKANKPMR